MRDSTLLAGGHAQRQRYAANENRQLEEPIQEVTIRWDHLWPGEPESWESALDTYLKPIAINNITTPNRTSVTSSFMPGLMSTGTIPSNAMPTQSNEKFLRVICSSPFTTR